MSSMDKIEPPLIKKSLGTAHPINQTKDFLLNLLSEFGFKEIQGPEIESEEFNFDMLNIKASHPARQMHDSVLEAKFIEKMMTQLTCQCLIKLRPFMLMMM